MKIKFKNSLHRKAFVKYISENISNLYCCRREYIAALFLLSADKLLWERSKSAVVRYSVNFGAIKLNGISTDGYALYKAAKTVYSGDSDISLSELCDWALIDDPKFNRILSNFTKTLTILIRCGIIWLGSH